MRRKHLNLLIKPTHECNMMCEYCYDRIEKTAITNKLISLDIIQDVITKVCGCYKSVTIIWHGGEALLAGEDFFYKAHEIIESTCYETNTSFNFLMQSNGLLYERYRIMLKDLNIKYSASLDYTNSNKYRTNLHQFNKLRNVLELDKIPIINVFSLEDVDELINVYEYSKTKKLTINFNKIFLKNETSEQVINFANRYNKYVEHVLFDKSAFFLERSFESMLNSILYTDDMICVFNECLMEFLSINPDGDIFICDRFGKNNSRKYGYMNIKDINSDISEFWSSDIYNKIKLDNAVFKNNFCKKCKINFLCKGCCKGNRISKDSIDLTYENISDCLFRQITFTYLFDRLYNLTEEEMLSLNPLVYKKLFENGFVNRYILE